MIACRMGDLTAKFVREAFSYDAETGELFWAKPRSNRVKVGARAGYRDKRGYKQIRIGQTCYWAHRVVWLYVTGEWPPGQLDHVNGDPSDNRILNLRPASPSENSFNTRRPSHNTSGVKGVTWFKPTRKWMAHITINQKFKSLGLYETLEEAAEARRLACTRICGEFANHG